MYLTIKQNFASYLLKYSEIYATPKCLQMSSQPLTKLTKCINNNAPLAVVSTHALIFNNCTVFKYDTLKKSFINTSLFLINRQMILNLNGTLLSPDLHLDNTL